MVNCLNCSNGYEGEFCPHCGQKAHTSRITLGGILHDIPHSVFHVDKGFIYTFVQLLRQPGKAIRDYVEGRRVKHYSPFAYLFVMSAACSLVGHLVMEYFEKYKDIHLHMGEGMLFPEVASFFQKYPGLMFCLFIPFISFWSWLFNRDSKYNYWENLVMNTYLIAQLNLLLIIDYTLVAVTGKLYGSLIPLFVIFFSYSGITYPQFFQAKMTAGKVLKQVFMFIMIVFTLLTGLSLTFMVPWWHF